MDDAAVTEQANWVLYVVSLVVLGLSKKPYPVPPTIFKAVDPFLPKSFSNIFKAVDPLSNWILPALSEEFLPIEFWLTKTRTLLELDAGVIAAVKLVSA